MKNNNYKYHLHPRLVNAIINRVNESVDLFASNNVYTVEGYTRLTTISQDGNQVVYHANPHLQGRMWYDWAMFILKKLSQMETPWKDFIQPKF